MEDGTQGKKSQAAIQLGLHNAGPPQVVHVPPVSSPGGRLKIILLSAAPIWEDLFVMTHGDLFSNFSFDPRHFL